MLNEAIATIATTDAAGLLLQRLRAICQSQLNNSTAQSFGGAEERYRAICSVRSMC